MAEMWLLSPLKHCGLLVIPIAMMFAMMNEVLVTSVTYIRAMS